MARLGQPEVIRMVNLLNSHRHRIVAGVLVAWFGWVWFPLAWRPNRSLLYLSSG